MSLSSSPKQVTIPTTLPRLRIVNINQLKITKTQTQVDILYIMLLVGLRVYVKMMAEGCPEILATSYHTS
jgi:hypothetical protein